MRGKITKNSTICKKFLNFFYKNTQYPRITMAFVHFFLYLRSQIHVTLQLMSNINN